MVPVKRLLSLAEQRSIACSLEPRYNAALQNGAVPGVLHVEFHVRTAGALEVALWLQGSSGALQYTCDENDLGTPDAYRAAVDWCYHDALTKVHQPVDYETQRQLIDRACANMRQQMYSMPGMVDLDVSMQDDGLLRIAFIHESGVRMSRCYRCTPYDKQNLMAFTAFVNRCFDDFGHLPQSEIDREVRAQMGVPPKRSPWLTALMVIGVIIAIASGVGIIFLIFVLLVGVGLSNNDRNNRRRRW